MIRTLTVSFETTTHAHQTLFPLRHPRHPRQWLVTQTALAWATLTVALHHGRRSPFARRPPPPQPSSESTHESPCAATHGCNTPRLDSLHEPRTLGDRKDKASTRTEAMVRSASPFRELPRHWAQVLRPARQRLGPCRTAAALMTRLASSHRLQQRLPARGTRGRAATVGSYG